MDNPQIKIPIHEFLPHREPMLMVDFIQEIDESHVICSFTVLSHNIFVADTVFQEVGLLEHMAQTCSSIVGQTYYSEDYNPELDKPIVGFISAIKSFEIFKLPLISETITTYANLKSQFDGDDYSICTMEVLSSGKGVTYAKAEINLFLKKEK